MGRPPIHKYNSTPFSRRICLLQKERGYSDEEVIAGVVDDNGNPLITGEQAYKTHKSGRSQPNNFQDMLRGYARFYDVSVDYLLELTDSPTPEIGSVGEVTGLSDAATRQLAALKDGSPELLKMLDTIISTASGEVLASLYARIYKDYKDSQMDIPATFRDISQAQQDSFAKDLYKYIRTVVTNKLASTFDEEIAVEDETRCLPIEEDKTAPLGTQKIEK